MIKLKIKPSMKNEKFMTVVTSWIKNALSLYKIGFILFYGNSSYQNIFYILIVSNTSKVYMA